jgi:alpha/beta superfamily hydrolase
MTAIRTLILLAFALVLIAGCTRKSQTNPEGNTSLADARKGYTTQLKKQYKANENVPEPPANTFRKVMYDTPVGKCAAYITPDPGDGKKHPAIVWITGGDCNTIGNVWKFAPASDDQTAGQYRDAGIAMMFPSLRGGNNNPGSQENFYGEVDDVLAAADYLAKQEYVDANRIYLGGHSTGGTLVLLVAEMPNKFRAVFSFGPADDIDGYPAQYIPAVNTSDRKEVELRSPGYWLNSIQCPTFVFEGTNGNASSLRSMSKASQNPKAKFFLVSGATHFSILAPVNKLIAQKIKTDTGAESNLSFTEGELNKLFER